MVLIGMLDSPYVRRVAIAMKLMGLAFEHRSISVFRQIEQFRAINPVVKAPSFVCDDGTVLMNSTLILDYLEGLVPEKARLMPPGGKERLEALRVVGLALAACEKAVQIHYELRLRPKDKQHAPWRDRVVGQALAAFDRLEADVAAASPWIHGGRFGASDLATAVAWRFGQHYDAGEIPASRYPALCAYSARAEALPEFVSTPLD